MVSIFHIIFRRFILILQMKYPSKINLMGKKNIYMKLDDYGPGMYLSTFPIAVMKCSLHPIFIN